MKLPELSIQGTSSLLAPGPNVFLKTHLARAVEETGWTDRRIRKALRAARREDHTYADGTILGSMCTQPHAAALHADQQFAATNLGDPDHFRGAKRLETEALADVADLLGAPKKAAGRFLTGGTEANLFACYVAREKTGRRTIVLPEHAHFSFEKAARMLDMRLEWVPSQADGRADVEAMRDAISDDTALVIGVAGTTELGLVDDIPGLARIATAAKVPLHVDAAFGGYVLPFLAGGKRFDFRIRGVWSVSLDPHKMGMSTIPAGMLFLREGRDWDHVAVETPYVSTDRQAQLLGTRPGGAAAATWAVHRALGRAGFRASIAACMDRTRRLTQGLKDLGIDLVAEPELNVVTFRVPDASATLAALDERGLRVNVVPRFSAIRIVVGPHVTDASVRRLLAALDDLRIGSQHPEATK